MRPRGVTTPGPGYDVVMTDSENTPGPGSGGSPRSDAERDLAEHERPEVGLVGDEDLPEDLRPTDDNPLAKNPDEDDTGQDGGSGSSADKVEGMPDMGDPGSPA